MFVHRLQHDHSLTYAGTHRFRTARRSQFGEQSRDVELDRVLGNAQTVSDLFVRETLGNHTQDFSFTGRQTGRRL